MSEESYYTTTEKAVYTDVVLPTVDHSEFSNDAKAQSSLLALLFEKLTIEHRSTTNSSLFLQLDPERKGVLAPPAFRTALENMGIPLTDTQLAWLMTTFDVNKDGGVDYPEFLKMLSALRKGSVDTAAADAGAAASTGLQWAPEPQASPFKAADDAREQRKRLVLEAYVDLLHRTAIASLVKDTEKAEAGTQTSSEGEEAAAAAAAAVVHSVLRKLAAVAFEKLGGLKTAFRHVDGDGDQLVSRDDLAHCLEHHLGLELPAGEFDALFSTLDFDGTGAVHYYEWIRVLSKYAEQTEGMAKPEAWSPAAALAPTPAKAPPAKPEKGMEVEVVEGDETAGLGYECDAVRKEDDAVLRRASEALHERGLHAHGLIKQLLPDCTDGKVDAGGLVTLFAKLGIAIDEAQAQRFVARADLMGNGKIVSWELVRLISSATPKEE